MQLKTHIYCINIAMSHIKEIKYFTKIVIFIENCIITCNVRYDTIVTELQKVFNLICSSEPL